MTRAATNSCGRIQVQTRQRTKRVRLGVALLEVVLSVSLLLVAMGTVGIVFSNGQTIAERTEQMIRARMITERLIAEMDLGILEMDEREQSGYFGEEAPPGMSWSVVIEPHEQVEGLVDVDIEIYMGDPDGAEGERIFLLATRIQRPEPRGIDFENDFGLDQEQLELLTEAIPGGVGVFDPKDFDMRDLASLDLDTLVELMPTLMDALGGQFGNNPQITQLLQMIQSGDLSAIQQAAGQFQAGGTIPLGGNQGGNQGGNRGGNAGNGQGGQRQGQGGGDGQNGGGRRRPGIGGDDGQGGYEGDGQGEDSQSRRERRDGRRANRGGGSGQ